MFVPFSKDMRDAADEIHSDVASHTSKITSRLEVFKLIHKFYLDTKDPTNLDPESKRFIEKHNSGYERKGSNKPKEVRDQIQDLLNKISNPGSKFKRNRSDSDRFCLFTRDQLKGIPEDSIAEFEEVKTDDGESNFKMNFSSNYVLEQLIKSRAQLAEFLGYNKFSEYDLEAKIAETPEIVHNLLNDLTVKLLPLGKKEATYMKDYKAIDLKKQGESTDTLECYYYSVG